MTAREAETQVPYDEQVIRALNHLGVVVGAHKASQASLEVIAAKLTAEAAEIARLNARAWVQCTTISNECLGGCRTMAEHDRYRAQCIAAEVESLRPLVALHEDMTRQKREAEAEVARLRADTAALVGEVRKAEGGYRNLAELVLRGGYAKEASRRAEEMHAFLAQPHPGASLLEDLKRKDEAIGALVEALEHTTHVALGLHAIYRQTATTESDGSHEALFSRNIEAVKAAREVLP